MISLIASQTTGSLPSIDSTNERRTRDEGTDSETEIFNLLPKNRAIKLSKKQNEVMDDMAPTRCRVFVAFLVMTTLIGFTMLVFMAVFGLWKGDVKLNGFDPLKQTRLVKHDDAIVTKVVIQRIQSYRLPRSLVPRKYELNLHVDVQKASYSGSVRIEALGESETDQVVLHSVGHEIEEARVTVPQDQDIVTGGTHVKSIGKDPVNGFLVLNLSDKLYKQVTYVLTIKFKGAIPKKADGFHLASVQAGREKALAVTNFEPIYARHMLPCFDEPEMRATFQLTVIHSVEMKVTTLAPRMRSVRLKDGLVKDQFLTTPPIPAYQLWLMIGQLKEDVSIATTGVTIQKFTTKNYGAPSSLTNHVVNTGMIALKGIFGVNYPIAKLKIAVLPEPVKGGGLGFMVLPRINASTSPLKRLQFMKVASQKLAKSWLDGLVRINWWTEHWLLSGLSIFISHNEVLTKLQPRLNAGHLFYLTYTLPALRRDQDKMTALALSKRIQSNRDVKERFDSCYGNKAASVIHLLSSAVGKNALKKSIRDFVKRKKHQGTDAFFTSLSKFSKWPRVEDPMDNWIRSPGYPVVHLMYSSSKQKMYAIQTSILAKKASDNSIFWRFPLKLRLSSSKVTKRVNLNHRKVTSHLPSKFRWLKANFGQQGLYRVKYSNGLWKGLVNQLNRKHTVLPEIDRAGLIDDAMSLARIGRLSYKSALQVAPYLKSEGSSLVWKTTVPHFCHVYALFHGHKQSFCVKSYLFGLIRHMIDKIGWLNHGNVIERELRPEILKFSTIIGDKKTIEECRKMFLKIVSSKKNYDLPWSLKSLIFKTAIQHGSEKEWKIIMNLYKTSKKHMKLALIAAAASRSARNIENFVVHLLSSENPPNNLLIFFGELSMNQNMNKLTWKLMIKHWNALAKSKDEAMEVLRKLIKTTSSRDQLNDVKEFVRVHPEDTKSMLLRALNVRIKETVDERTHRIDIIESIQKASGRKC